MQLGKQNKAKQIGTSTKVVLLHEENSPAHKSVVEMAAVRDCGFEVELVDHPPYSPDLTVISTTHRLCACEFS